MTSKELKELEGKRILFYGKDENGLYCKFEGKVFVEETIATTIKDGESKKVKRCVLILKEAVVNNYSYPYKITFSPKRLKEIVNYKVV